VWGNSVQPDHLNPAIAGSAFATEVLDALFLRLADFGEPPELNFEPVLASGWDLSEDGKTLTYHLRRDVVWEDGTPTTAEDVAFTFDLISNPKVPFPDRSQLRGIEACEVVDRWTVRFRFSEPSWEPIYDTRFHVLPAHVLRDLSVDDIQGWEFNRAPIGNGWWRVSRWVANDHLVLEASETCGLGRPGFDRIVIRVIPERTTLRTELLTGGVDVYHRVPNRYYREDADNPDLMFFRVPDRGYVYIGWNLRNPRFADARVREALTLAVDRQTIVDAFRDGLGRVMAVPLYPSSPDLNPDVRPLPFDPERAAALLDEAGWTERDADGVRMKDGLRFEFTYTLVSGNEISEEIATMTEAEFRKLGIAVRVEFYEWTVYLERIDRKEFDATVLSRRNDLVYDPEDVFHSRGIEGRYNDVSFSDPTIDSLIDLAKTIRDRRERRAVWWRYQEVFRDRTPVTVLYAGEANYAVRRDKVAGAAIDIRGALRGAHAWRPVDGRGP
jgi:peptide/nickel transport system substrate-binding protein